MRLQTNRQSERERKRNSLLPYCVLRREFLERIFYICPAYTDWKKMVGDQKPMLPRSSNRGVCIILTIGKYFLCPGDFYEGKIFFFLPSVVCESCHTNRLMENLALAWNRWENCFHLLSYAASASFSLAASLALGGLTSVVTSRGKLAHFRSH